jgi:hypothetical protein
VILDEQQQRTLGELHGTLEDGYTAAEVLEIAEALEQATGFRFAVVWAYRDRWGCGGDSEEFLLAENGTLYEIPHDLHAYMAVSRFPLDVDAIEQGLSAPQLSGWRVSDLVDLDGANFALADYGSDEAPRF